MSFRDFRVGLRASVGFAASLVIAGCAAGAGAPGGGARPASASGEPTFLLTDRLAREIATIRVRDEAGETYDHPFLGGFDVPRPQFVDIDGDGDQDLFVQERTDELIFFENTGSASQAEYTWRTDVYQDLPIGEWSRFYDMDQDGDLDLLAEAKFSYIRYFRNDGSAQEARFVAAADTIFNPDGEPVFSDRQNIPNLTDIDGDGLVDLFLGRVDGTVTRYEEVRRRSAGDMPVFELVTERFEDIEIVAAIAVPGQVTPAGANRPGGGQPDEALQLLPEELQGSLNLMAPTLHGANSMAFADVDDDGDQDFFWGDFFEPGLLWIENLGTPQVPDLRATPQPVPADELIATSGYNASAIRDLDADGDQDLLIGVLGGAFNPNITAADNLLYYEQLPSGEMTQRSSRFLSGIDVGSESFVTVGDTDGDGDDDILIGSKLDPTFLRAARLYHYRNEGSAAQPVYVLTDTIAPVDTYHFAPVLADMDADGDDDIVLGTWNQDVLLLRNDGGVFTASETVLADVPRGSHSTPALGDLDGDGDLDMVVGESSGELNHFENVGTAAAPVFEVVSQKLGDIDAGRRSAPALVDVDGDGDLDLIVGSESDGVQLFINVGTRTAPEFEAGGDFPVPLPGYGRPVFADVDGDGDLDVLSGGMGGGVVFYRNQRER